MAGVIGDHTPRQPRELYSQLSSPVRSDSALRGSRGGEPLPSRHEEPRGQTVAAYDLTRLDMSDLDGPLVRHLLTVGEPLHVERKCDVPTAESLSELLGSMGNTEGGWALLGVEDDGTIVGLKRTDGDLQDAIRDRVQGTLDPLPNFAARRLRVNGVEIGIVRVYASEDTPLVSTHKGAPYIRLPGGKRPVQSRRELDRLVERGRASEKDARASCRPKSRQPRSLLPN
jgi:hypothetical protein